MAVTTMDELISACERHGTTIEWGTVPTLGAYDHATRTIWLDNSLSSLPRHGLSILAHEFAHAIRGDIGPQPDHVERQCDLAAAGLLVSPSAYARAERLHGANVDAIAEELGVASFIVEAHRLALVA